MRCSKVEELIMLLEYDANQLNIDKNMDLSKIKEILKDLIVLFGKSSQSEIEVLCKFMKYLIIFIKIS